MPLKSLFVVFCMLLSLRADPLRAQAEEKREETAFPTATVAIHLVLLKIDSYTAAKEIRQAVERLDGVYRVSPYTETRDLLIYEVDYSDLPDKLTRYLREELGGRYTTTQKLLPSGVTEINVAKGR